MYWKTFVGLEARYSNAETMIMSAQRFEALCSAHCTDLLDAPEIPTFQTKALELTAPSRPMLSGFGEREAFFRRASMCSKSSLNERTVTTRVSCPRFVERRSKRIAATSWL